MTERELIKTAIEKDIQSKDVHLITDKTQSELLTALEKLQNPECIETSTILTNAQVLALSNINYFAQVYDVNFFKHFIEIFPRYRISGDDGRGRKEQIQIAEAIQRQAEREHEKALELLTGRR